MTRPAKRLEERLVAARDGRRALSGLATDDVAAWLAGRGEPRYRLRQVADWYWRHGATEAAAMRTLPGTLRDAIESTFRLSTLAETTIRPGDQGLTEKALHKLDDGALVESVLMRYPARAGRRERATVCVSSQVGCAVGCPFCATGELGFIRDLEAAEIVDQVRFWSRRLAGEGLHLTNVVLMGMGEPLLNLDRVLDAIEAICDPRRFALGARHVTVSTSGVVPGIERLASLRPQWTLAISLHAVRPELRDLLVPLNRTYPVGAVVAAAAAYARATGRRVSFEYVMIDDVNDTPADAADLARLLRGHLAHVNLIPMNPVAHTAWRPSPSARIADFAAALGRAGVATTVRRTRGEEIGAACGQLAAEGVAIRTSRVVRAAGGARVTRGTEPNVNSPDPGVGDASPLVEVVPADAERLP